MGLLWLIFIVAFNFVQSSTIYDLRIAYEWKQIEYEFESEDQRAAAIANGSFAIGNVQPIDVQQTNFKPKDKNLFTKYFITTPRLTPKGVPASLSIITNKTIDKNPVLRPYPHWSWHINPESCNEKRIVSVVRVWWDDCGRLWVVDGGFVGTKMVCNPQILAFDFLTDELLFKYEIPQSVHKNKASYNTPIAEVVSEENSCLDTWLYVADPITPSLLVYSLKLNQSWAVKDATFEPNEKWSNLTVAGDSLSLNYGIVTVALSPPRDRDQRKLSYHAFANVYESYVYTKQLRNVSLLENGGGDIFHTYPHPRNQQSGIEAYDRTGKLHFSLLNDIRIVTWSKVKQYEPKNFVVVANNKKTMQFPTAIKIGKAYQNLEAIWVFSTRFQKWFSGKLSNKEINFRIYSTYLYR